jgi:beta-lactamase regulating signal transducer with metallopeptidase domain
MSAAWLTYDVLLVALLAVVARAVESLCRQVGWPTRWSWLAAATTAIALMLRAAFATDVPAASAALPNGILAKTTVESAAGWTLTSAFRDASTTVGASVASLVADIVRLLPSWLPGAAAALWIMSTGAALVVLALVHRRIRRARRGWPEADLHGRRVRITPDVGPAVVGVLRPEIVVPRWLLGCSGDEQRLVLEHEGEHLRGRDHLLLGAGCLVVALVPWHPAVWWMLARLRLAIELDCDARVIRRGVPVRSYGTLLIDLAGRCTGFGVGATALAEEGSHLERRLLAMNANRTGHRWLRAGLLGAAAGLALLAACEAKVPTGPQIDAMDAASAERAATGLQMFKTMHGDSLRYFIDGRAVDARTANSLTPNQIATVNISKGERTGEPSMLRITTNGEPPRPDAAITGGMSRLHATMRSDLAHDSKTIMVRTPGDSAAAPLLLIDGVRADFAAMHALDPKSIVSVNVIKGAAAAAMSSDPAAKNGIIRITTRQ